MTTETLFSLGQIVMTPGIEALDLGLDYINATLARHHGGDWGDLSGADWCENDLSVEKDLRLLSSYHTHDGTKFWILTEADRSVTTVLLPEEY